MEFIDEAIVLSARRHGEANLVLSALTREHGRHLGLVKGGASRRQRPALEIGNRLKVTWHARLEEQLGAYTIEPLASVAGLLLDSPLRLAALASACAVADLALPEREPHADVFDATAALLAALTGPADGAAPLCAYVRWELALLAALGFGLDLSRCAATGETGELAYVSPKSGRAVSLSAGEGYRDRLLPLPGFLRDARAAAGPADLLAGLRLTGFFLDRHVLPTLAPAASSERRLEARGRFIDRIAELKRA
jgi:DNA repair protein RecO (recombination protein O)